LRSTTTISILSQPSIPATLSVLIVLSVLSGPRLEVTLIPAILIRLALSPGSALGRVVAWLAFAGTGPGLLSR
jgi:hypothetical protein